MSAHETERQDARPAAKQRSSWRDLGPGWISAIGTLLAAIFAGIGLLISNAGGSGHGGGTPSQPAANVLAPANVPPRVGLCSQQLTIGADGDAGPISCANGDLNELAWQYLNKANLNVMALGADATPDQVLRAMCSDFSSVGTRPIEVTAYEISRLYYGWHFGVDPSQEFMNGGCPGGS